VRHAARSFFSSGVGSVPFFFDMELERYSDGFQTFRLAKDSGQF
jgi:hypothetical protein